MATAMSSAASTFQRSGRLSLSAPQPKAMRAVARRQVRIVGQHRHAPHQLKQHFQPG